MIGLHHRLVLNSDVVVREAGTVQVPGLAPVEPGEFVLTRTSSRSPSLQLNGAAAEFLLAFSQPCTLLAAVQLTAKRTGASADEILEELYPNLKAFVDRGILVRLSGVKRVSATPRIGAWSLERRIHDFDETSVFLAKDAHGRFGALKLGKNASMIGVIDREKRVLELAGGVTAPPLLDYGIAPEGAYLVTGWKSGAVAPAFFSELRKTPSPRRPLLDAAIRVVGAFADLHSRGIVHGDIQPKNVLFDLRDRVWLIDFSHSAAPGLTPPTARMGVPFFFEPEYARTLLLVPPASVAISRAGEIYAIGALLFNLLSGVHSIEFSLEREELLRQIVEVEPKTLTDPRGVSWESAGRALAACLAKNPDHRPRSLGELRAALEEALAAEPERDAERATSIRRRTPPESLLKSRFGLASSALQAFDVGAPRCSLSFGAAGIAYALLRAAGLTGDSEFLWAADAWIEQADRRATEPEAFTSAALDLTRRKIGFASLSNAEPGLFYVKALVRSAMGDSAGTRMAIERFLAAAVARPSRPADVNLGGAGLAIAACRLSQLPSSAVLSSKLRAFAHSLIAHAWEKTPVTLGKRDRLGFAHGAAGLIFATLACEQSSGAGAMVDQLRGQTAMLTKGVRWPVQTGGSFFMPGWCNGVAGHLLLWIKLWQRSGLEEDREMLDRIAWGIWESRTSIGNVCCGASGQAIALAALASATSDPVWRNRAAELMDNLKPHWPKDDRPQSLFRGELGMLLAQLECQPGVPAVFPVWGASLS